MFDIDFKRIFITLIVFGVIVGIGIWEFLKWLIEHINIMWT